MSKNLLLGLLHSVDFAAATLGNRGPRWLRNYHIQHLPPPYLISWPVFHSLDKCIHFFCVE